MLLRKKILEWFQKNKRDLPWRVRYEPYHVWISEIMLQQTQMERGVEYFNRWLKLFPDVRSVAWASEQEILKAWEGLGYYSRARNIKRAALKLVDEYGGQLPDTHEKLLALPGIGPYTAGAIMSIAFDKPYPVVDANVERLFSRILDISTPIKQKESQEIIKDLTTELLKEGSPRDINQALMEFGALVCTPKNPDCTSCSLNFTCKAYTAGTMSERPVKAKPPETIDIVMACVMLKRGQRYYIQQRQKNDVWGGLWEFPGGRLKEGETAEEAAVRELLEETELECDALKPFRKVIYHYTRYRVILHSFLGDLNGGSTPQLHAATQFRWVSMEELDNFAFPSGHRQLIRSLQGQREGSGN